MDKDKKTLLNGLNPRPVLVIGDLMLDHYIHGDVTRQAPESLPDAPVPVLSATYESLRPGGAASVVANIGGLGAQSRVLGVIASDDAGAKLRNLLASYNADTQYLGVVADRPTTVKMRFVTGPEQKLLLRADYEKACALAPADQAGLIARIEDAMKGCGAVVMSDYGKGVLTAAVMKAVIDQARAQNIPVLVDPKGRDFTIYNGADIITPNAKELGEATNMPTLGQDDVIKAATHLLATADITTVIAKRSEHGMSVISRNQPPLHLAATARQVLGVAGAGDTVIATLAVALSSGLDLAQAATLANEAAGVIVAQPGTTPITRAELLAALSADTSANTPANTRLAAPVMHDGAAARAQIDAWKKAGEKIGFTNGCFDILHYGHVNYLSRARARCDRLVVGVNTDASITRLKGAGRPVHEALSRGAVLAALGAVDMVVFFGDDPADDDKPLRLIEALRPDICFKGGDYKRESLPEAALVLAYGGQFEIMPLYEGHSTSAAIRKMQKDGEGASSAKNL